MRSVKHNDRMASIFISDNIDSVIQIALRSEASHLVWSARQILLLKNPKITLSASKSEVFADFSEKLPKSPGSYPDDLVGFFVSFIELEAATFPDCVSYATILGFTTFSENYNVIEFFRETLRPINSYALFNALLAENGFIGAMVACLPAYTEKPCVIAGIFEILDLSLMVPALSRAIHIKNILISLTRIEGEEPIEVMNSKWAFISDCCNEDTSVILKPCAHEAIVRIGDSCGRCFPYQISCCLFLQKILSYLPSISEEIDGDEMITSMISMFVEYKEQSIVLKAISDLIMTIISKSLFSAQINGRFAPFLAQTIRSPANRTQGAFLLEIGSKMRLISEKNASEAAQYGTSFAEVCGGEIAQFDSIIQAPYGESSPLSSPPAIVLQEFPQATMA